MDSRHPAFRIGHGYDLHRLAPRAADTAPMPDPPAPDPADQRGVKPLIVGGVRLESPLGLIAHSDGDVLLHAVTDALLGALGLPDIGQLFPDHAAENAARNSADFVREALHRVRDAGYTVSNLDATVILERPRIGPVKDAMRSTLAALLAIPTERVNIKGKSHERVDAVGEGRAIECHVVVLLATR